MDKEERNRVVFHSTHDMSSGIHLSRAEKFLNGEAAINFDDINDILELYNICLFFENDMHLKSWSDAEVADYKEKSSAFKKEIGTFITNINDSNFLKCFKSVSYVYYGSFWMLMKNYQQFKKISPSEIETVLKEAPGQIRFLLKYKALVDKYRFVLCGFLKANPKSAEIILSKYEVENRFNSSKLYLPSCLTVQDKENIISSYVDSEDCNVNYLPIIQNAKKYNDFYISDKIKLAAKRKYQKYIEYRSGSGSDSLFKYGVDISYPENSSKIKHAWIEQDIVHYEFSLDYIKKKNHPYTLYRNFKDLFEYVDEHNIISLISKENQLGVFERTLGVRSKSEYVYGLAFRQLEMASMGQIHTYSNVLKSIGESLENILQTVFNDFLPELYGLPSNANLTIPTESASALEKIRVIAPEFESILKQYKLFVEDKQIDFELLQMSSGPTAVKDVPSLNNNKYIYINRNDPEVGLLVYYLFSDQTLLTYVDPFKDNQYSNFVDLLVSEEEIRFRNYEGFQHEDLKYLIDKGYIFVDEGDCIQVANWNRILILRDIFENEVASFYHYTADIQDEVLNMSEEGIVFLESSLFAIPEQNYLNYYLNRSEFNNGYDLRNSYLHGTQANPDKIDLHKYSYLTYLKLLVLVVLKIEDDLLIYSDYDNSYERSAKV
ncbi:hypothetical protein [Thalassolituus maritimus]